MWECIVCMYLYTAMMKVWSICHYTCEELFYLGDEIIFFLPVQIHRYIIIICRDRRRFYHHTCFCTALAQCKRQRSIGWDLFSFFTPVFDYCYIGRALVGCVIAFGWDFYIYLFHIHILYGQRYAYFLSPAIHIFIITPESFYYLFPTNKV